MKRSFRLLAILSAVYFITDRSAALLLEKLEENIYSGQGVGKVNVFMQVKDSLDVLVLGSSRAAHHVDTELLEGKSFNMGMDGTKLGYASALFKMLEKKNQIVLVHVDHHNLCEKEYVGDDLSKLTYLTLKNPVIKGYFDKFRKEDLILSKISNTYAFNGKLFPILKNTILKSATTYFDSNGFEPLLPNENQKKAFALLMKEQKTKGQISHQKNDIKSMSPLAFSFLKSIGDHAKSHRIKLIFFTSPSLMNVDEEAREMTKSVFKDLGVTYWDHMDFFERFDPDLWKDQTHLSYKGASEYTDYLSSELRKH